MTKLIVYRLSFSYSIHVECLVKGISADSVDPVQTSMLADSNAPDIKKVTV